MPRHEPPPLPVDPRLRRPSPDRLPSHRQCTGCAAVLPLDRQHFYEVSTRFAWNMSRFGFQCIPCACAAARASYAKRKEAANARKTQRRREERIALRRSNMTAAVLQESRKARRLKEQESHSRRERFALLKRVNNRTYGTRPDAIKLMIKANSEMYMQRRLAHLEAPSAAAPGCADERQDHLALLQALRAKHRRALDT